MFRNRWFLTGLVLLLTVSLGLAATTFQHLLLGSTCSLLTLSSLTSGTLTARGATCDPRIGQTGQGYLHAIVECNFTFTGTPADGTAVVIWFLKTSDGTNFENTNLTRTPDMSCPVASTSPSRVSFAEIPLPPWRFGAIAYNQGTGVTISGSIVLTPYTVQGNP